MLTKNPKARLVAYVIGLIALLILVALLGRGVIDKETAWSLYDGLELILSLCGVSVAGLAAKMLGKQIGNNTLDYSGSPADQAIAAAKAAAELAASSAAQAANNAADLERVKSAITDVVKDVPVFGPLTQRAIDALPHH